MAMTVPEIMDELKSMGSESIKKILLKHGVKEPFFGVKVEQLKTIQKKIKKDYNLSKGLYATGNADAMYLAGLIADDAQMTKEDLQTWVELATSQNISEYTVPWVAAEGNYGWEMAMKWIDSPVEHIAASGWATLCGLLSLKSDSAFDLKALEGLLQRVEQKIHTAQNREKQTMNHFIISVGAYTEPLHSKAMAVAEQVGVVSVDMNGTACKVPLATEYINKARKDGKPAKKKKTVKC